MLKAHFVLKMFNPDFLDHVGKWPDKIWSNNRKNTWEFFFLKNDTQNVMEKLILETDLSTSLDLQFRMLWICFLFYVQVKVHQNILKLRCRLLAYTLYSAFSKIEKRTSFSVWFLNKNVSHVIFY